MFLTKFFSKLNINFHSRQSHKSELNFHSVGPIANFCIAMSIVHIHSRKPNHISTDMSTGIPKKHQCTHVKTPEKDLITIKPNLTYNMYAMEELSQQLIHVT